MNSKLNIILCLLFLGIPFSVIYSQDTDTTEVVNIEFITDQLEYIAQSSDLMLDYSDLIDDYLYYSKNPVNINSPDIITLRDIYLINDIQLNNIRLYINQFGQLCSIYELSDIAGFNKETIKKIQPFIFVEPFTHFKTHTIKDVFTYGKHQLLIRYNQILETRKGYLLPSDSAINNPGSVYLGKPQHYYLRYSFNYKNKLRFGFTMDKDAGEVLFKRGLNDSLRSLIDNKLGYGYDFLSAFAYAEDISVIKKIVIGDYHLEFGQGLTLWSGLSFGKSSEAVQMKKFGRGIRPNTSANENRFLRGIATSIAWKGILFTSFYSSNNIDGNIIPLVYNQQEGISSIIETGMHRTVNELLDKNTFNIKAFGANLLYKYRVLAVGITAYNTLLDKPISISDNLYKLFDFQGTNITNYGTDISINLNNVNFFGEFSASSNGGLAGLAGINTFLHQRFFLTLMYHNYGKEYQNLYSNPFAESSSIANEKGIYMGFKTLITKNISISGYIDHYEFPWLKYRVSSPSAGRDYLIQVNINPTKNIISYLKYRYKNKAENYKKEYSYLHVINDIDRHDIRLFVSYKVYSNIILKNRVDFVVYSNCYSEKEHGYLIYQDILYRSGGFPVEASFRYSLFSTDGYNSRIYTYENDVLYAFSIPSYFNSGQRWYLMLKWTIVPQVTMWLRFARTTYFSQNTIGSGNDLIEGNSKSEVKAEIKVKF